MKVCIVTLYKTLNCGSYYQAYALRKKIEEYGHEVFFLDVNYTLKVRIKSKLRTIKKILSRDNDEVKRYIEQNRRFIKKQQEFNSIKYKHAMKDIDCFVLGSDTIWNLDSKNLTHLRKFLWGGAFYGKAVISYAASVANTKKERIEKYPELINYLNNCQFLSVRDFYTYDIIKQFTEKNIAIVCDPTLLLRKNDFFNKVSQKFEFKYIFLYLFEDLNDEQICKLKKFAKDKNLQIVSGTEKIKWCDIHTHNEPKDFINYMFNADFVITDTFHGTIFSSNFEKKFVSINRNKNKVNNYLKEITLENRLINNKDDIIRKLIDNIDYEKVNKKIESMRKNSESYLQDSLKNVKK